MGWVKESNEPRLLLGNYGESGMEAFKDMAAKEGICIAHSGKTSQPLWVIAIKIMQSTKCIDVVILKQD